MTSLASSIVYLIEIHADEAVLVKALQSGHLLLVGSQEPWLSITSAFSHSGARPKLSGPLASLLKSVVFQDSMTSCTFHVREM
jgi:hypothetical protein